MTYIYRSLSQDNDIIIQVLQSRHINRSLSQDNDLYRSLSQDNDIYTGPSVKTMTYIYRSFSQDNDLYIQVLQSRQALSDGRRAIERNNQIKPVRKRVYSDVYLTRLGFACEEFEVDAASEQGKPANQHQTSVSVRSSSCRFQARWKHSQTLGEKDAKGDFQRHTT